MQTLDTVALGTVKAGTIVRIDDEFFEVTDIKAGIGKTQLEPVVFQSGRWTSAIKAMRRSLSGGAIYPSDTQVTIVS